jgi:hypothetical protein
MKDVIVCQKKKERCNNKKTYEYYIVQNDINKYYIIIYGVLCMIDCQQNQTW